MVNLPYIFPVIYPRTFEEAQWVGERGKIDRAQKNGDWLPEGWKWEEWPVEGLGYVEGALCKDPLIFVYLVPPSEGQIPRILMAGTGGAPPVVFDMVFNRWMAPTG